MDKKGIKLKSYKRIIITCSIILAVVLLALIIAITSKKNKSDIQLNDIVGNVAENKEIIVDITERENETNIDETFGPVTGDAKYYIRVNYGAQVVNVYKKDEEGNYTVPVKAMICSTGEYTPKSGTYSIPGRWIWGLLQGNVYGQYVTVITGNILFHSVPYTKRDPSSLEYWEYDKLGTDASAGCVRLKVEDAKWIYDNCKNGTKVEFYSSENPGPFGKPTAMKIADYEDKLRNWDPTDPNPNNPWNGGSGIVNSGNNNQNGENSNEQTKPNTEVQNPTPNPTQNETIPEEQNTTKNEVKPEEQNPTQNETKPEEQKPTQNETKPEEQKPSHNETKPEEQKPTQNETKPEEQKPQQNETKPEEQKPTQNETKSDNKNSLQK